MDKNELSTVFVSHGAPTMPFEDIPAKNFLTDLGSRYKDIKAVLCISAHWETSKPTVNSVDLNETIHDFYGFQPELYDIKYPAKGFPEMAEHTYELINDAALNVNWTITEV